MKRFATWLKRHKFLAVLCVLIISYLIVCIVSTIDENNRKHEAQLKLDQATTLSDPVSDPGIYIDVNVERHKAGIPALANNPQLQISAQEKCDDMVANDYFEHVNPQTGKHGYQYIDENVQNRRTASENLVEGSFFTSEDVVTGWLNSPAHKAAMLDPQYTDTGIAICHRPSQVDGAYTVVEHFASFYR